MPCLKWTAALAVVTVVVSLCAECQADNYTSFGYSMTSVKSKPNYQNLSITCNYTLENPLSFVKMEILKDNQLVFRQTWMTLDTPNVIYTVPGINSNITVEMLRQGNRLVVDHINNQTYGLYNCTVSYGNPIKPMTQILHVYNGAGYLAPVTWLSIVLVALFALINNDGKN